MLPLTVTLSIILIFDRAKGVIAAVNYPLISKGTPNYLVAASSLDAMLTLGERYEASIL